MDELSPRAIGQAAGSSPTSSRKHRPRKLLKLSVIKRICKVPKTKFKKGSKRSANVVYTNSQFGLEPIPCKESGCTSCSLAPPRPKGGKSNLLAKRPRPTVSSSLLAKIKRQCTECKANRSSSNSSTIITQAEADELIMREHHCVCTEVDGQLYKLMDTEMNTNMADTNYKDLSSLLDTLRELQPDKEPRSSSKLNVDNKND
ncbi:hypothetical protein ACLKA6_006404 [Drosophila palustris]